MHRSLASLTLTLTVAFAAGPGDASAQRRVQYDTLAESTPAAVSCGFCAGEKFGMVFRPLSGGRGLQPADFPLNLNSIEIAVARTQVVLGGTGFVCEGASGPSTVMTQVEAYAGTTPPSGSILARPANGPWDGETMLFAMSQELTLSVETTPGTAMFEVMFNTISVSDVRVDAPNTYIRVAVTIPTGGSSISCELASLMSPGAVGIRDDDGRIDDEVNMIYSVSPGDTGWKWSEDVPDQLGAPVGINGDWAIRLNVASLGGVTPADAGPPPVDAGPTPPDAGPAPGTDAGPSPTDAGATPPAADAAPPMGCTSNSECSGGEVCEDGMCRRVACTAASDCAGGQTCVGNFCRNLCTSDSECAGGEVCDTAAGSCAPVGSLSDGGCGCRAARRSTSGFAWALPALGLLLWRRRRS